MLRFLLVLLCLSYFMPAAANAHEITVESNIREVTVYTNRAKLTRHAVVEVPAGAHTLIFENMPVSLLPDSLRVDGSSVADVTFGALSHKVVANVELIEPREKEINDKIEAINDNKKAIEDKKKALSAKKSFLESLGNNATLRTNENIAEINLKPEQWGSAADTIHTGIADILRARQEHDIKLRELSKELTKLYTELNQVRTGRRNSYQISIPVEVSEDTSLKVDLSFQVPGASWRPIYDARLDTETGDLELIQYGAVRQNTGEDWNDVALVLSTAQPHRGAGLPDLNPMWVNIYDHRVMRKGRGANMLSAPSVGFAGAPMEEALSLEDSEGRFYATDAAAVRKEKAASFVAAKIETGGFVSEYVIAGRKNRNRRLC
jgi:uncharacterized protein (TIGR02231 family)